MNGYPHLGQSDRKTRWNMKSEICIISCGAKKAWDSDPGDCKIPVKDLFTGCLFKKCRKFAEAFYPDNWYILSGKYGLIHPDKHVRYYHLKTPSVLKGNLEYINFVKRQADLMNLKPTIIVSTCGNVHQSVVNAVFTNSKIINPLSGLGQGKRMQKINHMLEAKNETRNCR